MINEDYDFVRPEHYKQDDGKETWERMVDKWGPEATALWCEMTAFKYEERLGKNPEKILKEKGEKLNGIMKKAIELRKEIL